MIKPNAERVAYRPSELAKLTGISVPHINKLVRDGVIPRLSNTGRTTVIPAWCVQSWLATGDWQDPTYKPNAAAPAAATAGA